MILRIGKNSPRTVVFIALSVLVVVSSTSKAAVGPKRVLRLQNLSARAVVRTGDDVLIGGLIIGGDTPRTVLLRAIGASLSDNGVALPGRLADPTLALFREGNSTAIATNDNWRDTQETEIAATGLQPGSGLDSAILVTLSPGHYTTVVRGKGSSSGIALVEAFDFSEDLDPALANISARGVVESGDNVLIGGFIVAPTGLNTGSIRVVIRAIGPSLTQYGIANPVHDPVLRVFDANGVEVADNDDWADGNSLDLSHIGLAPPEDKEAALLLSLAIGNYTAIVSAKDQASGTALVEVYDVSAVLP